MTAKETAKEAHLHFSAECFNLCWQLMEKPDRSAEDDELMLHLSKDLAEIGALAETGGT